MTSRFPEAGIMAVSVSACLPTGATNPETSVRPFTAGLTIGSRPNPRKVMKWTQGHSKVPGPLIFLYQLPANEDKAKLEAKK